MVILTTDGWIGCCVTIGNKLEVLVVELFKTKHGVIWLKESH
jgi:hypothetical protein